MTDLFAKPTVDRRGNTRIIGLGDQVMDKIDEDQMESARSRAETAQESSKPLDQEMSKNDQQEEQKEEQKEEQ